MGRASTFTPRDIEFYEGLVFKTASMYSSYVEEDFEDIQQVLRIKVWRALEAFDPTRSNMTRQRYVFSCVKNQCKDLVKKKRRNELFIEDLAPVEVEQGQLGGPRDRFDWRYLSADADQAYGAVESAPPLIPSTLSKLEREVLALLYLDFSQKEAATLLGVRRNEMERAVKSLRDKMADWRPTPAAEPLPAAA